MQDTLRNHASTISVGGLEISNLIFATDIGLISGSKAELKELTNILFKASIAYGIEVGK